LTAELDDVKSRSTQYYLDLDSLHSQIYRNQTTLGIDLYDS